MTEKITAWLKFISTHSTDRCVNDNCEAYTSTALEENNVGKLKGAHAPMPPVITWRCEVSYSWTAGEQIIFTNTMLSPLRDESFNRRPSDSWNIVSPGNWLKTHFASSYDMLRELFLVSWLLSFERSDDFAAELLNRTMSFALASSPVVWFTTMLLWFDRALTPLGGKLINQFDAFSCFDSSLVVTSWTCWCEPLAPTSEVHRLPQLVTSVVPSSVSWQVTQSNIVNDNQKRHGLYQHYRDTLHLSTIRPTQHTNCTS